MSKFDPHFEKAWAEVSPEIPATEEHYERFLRLGTLHPEWDDQTRAGNALWDFLLVTEEEEA